MPFAVLAKAVVLLTFEYTPHIQAVGPAGFALGCSRRCRTSCKAQRHSFHIPAELVGRTLKAEGPSGPARRRPSYHTWSDRGLEEGLKVSSGAA